MNAFLKRGSWQITGPIVAMTVLYLTCVYFPGRQESRRLCDELRIKHQDIAQGEPLTRQMQLTAEQLAATRKYVAEWKDRLPAGGTAGLFGEISRLAKQSGVLTTRFEPQPPVQHHQLRQIPLQLGVTGSVAQLHSLLASLERLPALLWVDELRIDRVEQMGQDLQCELKLAVFADKSNFSD